MEERPSQFLAFVHATRPKTLPLSLSPVLLGAVVGMLEQGAARIDILLVALGSAAAIQIGTNLHNDAADALNQTDTEERAGPPRACASGWLSPGQVKVGAHLSFGAALLGGLYLTAIGGWLIFAVGLASLLAGYGYSSGPAPISRGPFGELFVLLFFGVIAVSGMAYLYSGTISPLALGLGCVIGLPASAVLLVNNTRDRVNDARAGRRTLAIMLGDGVARRLYATLLLTAIIGAAGVCLMAAPEPAWGGLAALALLPWAVSLSRAFAAAGARSFNALLARTARLQLTLALVVSAGLTASIHLGA